MLLLFGSLIFGVLELTTKPKTPATSNIVWNTVVSQGYEPEDIADKYHNQDPESKNSLLKCIAFKNSDVHFEFFELNNNSNLTKTLNHLLSVLVFVLIEVVL